MITISNLLQINVSLLSLDNNRGQVRVASPKSINSTLF